MLCVSVFELCWTCETRSCLFKVLIISFLSIFVWMVHRPELILTSKTKKLRMIRRENEWKNTENFRKPQELWMHFFSYCQNTHLYFMQSYYSPNHAIPSPLKLQRLSWNISVLIFLFFFDNLSHHVITPGARDSAVFHSMRNRWWGRAGMDAPKERKTFTLRLTHWDPADPGTQSPSHRDCNGFLCLYTKLHLCMYVSKLLAHYDIFPR